MSAGQSSKWKYVPIGAIIAVIATFLIFGYTEWYKPPFLSFEILQPYPSSPSECVVPLTLRNEGHDVATSVRVTIEARGAIVLMHFESPEEVSIDGNNTMKALLTFSRLNQDVQITIFLRVTSESDLPIKKVWITSDQGPGHLYDPSRIKYEQILVWFAAVLVGLGLTWIITILWRIMRERILVRRISAST